MVIRKSKLAKPKIRVQMKAGRGRPLRQCRGGEWGPAVLQHPLKHVLDQGVGKIFDRVSGEHGMMGDAGWGRGGGTRAICRAMGVGRLKWRRVMRSGIWVRGRTIGWLRGSSPPIWPVPRYPPSVRSTCEPATRVSVTFTTVRTDTDTGACAGSLVRTRIQ